jgi:CubicO group peptidase (beta-lactamase class C family)
VSRTSSGFDQTAVEQLLARAQAEVAKGRVPACQIGLARGGEVITETFGAPPELRFLIFSLTKSLVAGAMWLLFGDGSVSPATRAAEIVPEFGTHGKDAVTVEHLLTHTGGFPAAPMLPEEGATSAGRVSRFAEWRLAWAPGTQTEYHPTSAHWVLAEIIERVTGTDYRMFLNDRVAAPLGLSSLQVGVPPEEQGDIVDAAVVGADTVAPERDTSAFVAETGARLLLRFNDSSVRALGVPGAGGVGSAGDLARYFSAMLRNDGTVWEPEVVRDATSVIRNTLPDPPTNVPANRTLGLKVAGDDGKAMFREFGSDVSPRAFICTGAGGQVVWADPETGLSFCFLTSGLDADVVKSFVRSSDLSTLAAACVRR